MMTRILTLALATALSLATFASCSNDPTLTGGTQTGSTLVFHQVDRVGEAGLIELFSAYTRHDASNKADVLADSAAMATDIGGFVTGSFGGRSTQISSFLQNLLTPDVLLIDTSQAGDASYLGVETNGLIVDSCNGPRNGTGKFGGRGLNEDVVDSSLGLVFGSTVPTIAAGSNVPNSSGAIADDGAEKDGRAGRPNLTTDNVGCGGKHFNFAQFPYVGNPL
jgi:Domain of unknown function (DUF4331)